MRAEANSMKFHVFFICMCLPIQVVMTCGQLFQLKSIYPSYDLTLVRVLLIIEIISMMVTCVGLGGKFRIGYYALFVFLLMGILVLFALYRQSHVFPWLEFIVITFCEGLIGIYYIKRRKIFLGSSEDIAPSQTEDVLADLASEKSTDSARFASSIPSSPICFDESQRTEEVSSASQGTEAQNHVDK